MIAGAGQPFTLVDLEVRVGRSRRRGAPAEVAIGFAKTTSDKNPAISTAPTTS